MVIGKQEIQPIRIKTLTKQIEHKDFEPDYSVQILGIPLKYKDQKTNEVRMLPVNA